MEFFGIILLLAIPLGLYMSWNIGANDVANAFGTSVGSGALSLRQALLIAAVFELLGAILVGGHVTQTIRKGIVNPGYFTGDPRAIVLGMFAALLSASVWIHIATAKGLPVSTTHSIVGGVVGFGLAAGGMKVVVWGKFLKVIFSWISSPVVGGFIAYFLFTALRVYIFQHSDLRKVTIRYSPVLTFLVLIVLTLSIFYKGSYVRIPHGLGWAISLGIGIFGGLLTAMLVRRMKWPDGSHDRLARVEDVFKYLQVLTACAIAFAHGANDVANAAGPVAAILSLARGGDIMMSVPVPEWVLLLMGGGIVIGLATWGHRVIETVGRRITEMTPSRGFVAQFGTAATVLVCSKLGFPISTTHTLVGSVIGVGFARGMTALNFSIIRTIVYSWVITVPFAAALTAGFYSVIRMAVG